MSSTAGGGILSHFRHELEALQARRVWFLVLGVALVVLGLIGLGMPWLFTLGTVLFYGILLLAGGIADIVGAFWARRWSGFALHLLVGILYVVVGVFMIERPGLAAAGFTLVLAVFFMVGGLFRIVVSVSLQFPNWGWVFVNGLITLALGVCIWRNWPEASLWVIGTFVGIEMIFNGWSWIMLGLQLRKLPQVNA